MIVYENPLPADDSHEISCLIFYRKLGKMSKILSSDTVVIDTLRVKSASRSMGLTHKGPPII